MSYEYTVAKQILKHKYLHEPKTLYSIREVYIDENGDVSHISENPYIVCESVEELKKHLQKMLDCCDKPIIDYNTGEYE